MKKWMAAIGVVLLLLVGVMSTHILQAQAGINSISADMVFDTVSIDNETIEKGKSITFSVSNPKVDWKIRGYKWTVKNGLTDFSSDEELFTGINTNTLTINDADKNCILDGATVSLTLIVDVNGKPSELPITNTAKLSASHTPGEDWIIDEEASSGAIQVSNQTCTACGTVVDTKEEVAPLENPVYVGGEALQNAGDSVDGDSGNATLYIGKDGSPVLVLNNYMFTGAGYENTEDNYAGIYYGGSDTLYVFCGPNVGGRAASQNTITVTAGEAASRGIYVPNGTLHIGTTGNETEDTLTVTAGTATKYSDGIYANQFKVQDVTIDLYTSTDVNSTGQYALTSNCVINANGGNTTGDGASTSTGISCATLNVSGGTVTVNGGDAEGHSLPYSYGINCTDVATFSGGKITATGGKASYEGMTAHTLWARTYGIKAASILISGADVTATGGTCGDLVSGKDNTRESYGCYGDITMTDGSLTATGGNLLMEDSSTGDRISYGIYGSISASKGTIEATGGNTKGGKSYGIYLNKDSRFSGEAVVTATTKTESTDDYRYGIYVKETNLTLTVEDSANVTATVAEGANSGASGIYANSSYITFIQTGGSVVASAPEANQAGAHFKKADISGGTFSATAKTTAFDAYELNLTGGDITGTSTSTLEDTMSVVSTGIKIETLTMTGGSLTGKGGEHTTLQSYGVYLTGNADVSGGTITGTGGHVFSEDRDVRSYGVNITGTLTLSGGTVTGTAGQASKTSEGVYIKNAILSNSAKIVGQGGISDEDNSVGVSINDASVSDTVTITGNGGSGANSMGIKYAGSTLSLLGGSLTATGGTGTTASYGLYTTNNFLMDGTLLTAKGNTSAVGCDSNEEISSDVIVVSTDIGGINPSPLQHGSHAISTLADYKYLKAGTTGDVGAQPGKRDISGATITLASSALTYSGLEQTMEVTSVKLGGVELLGEVTISGNTATDAGTYTLTVTAKDSSYYTGSAEKPFTVNPLKITPDVTVTGGPYAYRSTVDPSAVVVKHGDVVLKLNVDYTVDIHTSTVGENGGIAYVYPINSGSNYTFDRVTANFTVVKAENPVEVTTPVTVIRGGNWVNSDYSNNQAGTKPSYSFDGADLGCTITENGTLTSGDTAGTVTVKATFPASGQYNEAVRTITVTITDKNRAELDWVTLADVDYKYNDETQLPQVYHSGSGSRVKEDIIEYSGTTRSGATYARSTTPPTQAGNYTVHVTYETKDTIYTGSDDFVIRPKDISNLITVTLGEALTYNGTEQTQTVTEVRDATADYTFDETEYDITGNKQTNAGNYSLDITGKGNFTGTKTVSYTIEKATPQLSDFDIPAYDDTVDYTGEYIVITPPTSTKIGMGDTHIETYVSDAGTYNVTFKVYEGDNYTAAEGLVYGTLTVNQVDRPTTTTNAVVILGGNEIDLDNYVSTEGFPAKTYEIVGDAHGCSLSNDVFTSGSEACTVTVQVTLEGNENYKETVKTFTVTVTDKKAALLTVTQPDVEYSYGEEIGNLSPEFTGQAGTQVSRTMVYAGTLWDDSSYASSEKPTQAGTYTVTVTYESKDTIYTGSTTFKINPTKIGGTITLGPALTYIGESQTQTIAQVQTGDYTYTEADYDVSGNVQTNAGTYTLTLTGKGNFTGTTSASYTIAKATPQRSDFNIPALPAVDYSGEEIPVALPTSIREGMGEVYLAGANIINAGNYVITFGVHDGKNYKAVSEFEYGTLTVNKVDHPMEVTNAIVGIGGKNIDLTTRVTAEFGYSPSFEFVTPEEERHGCQISGATFTSGNEPGIVTVRATVEEAGNYLETSKEFTVEVVEEGGVNVWGYVTSSGDISDETTIQLLQGGVAKYEMAKVGNSPMYSFDGVAAGTYTLRISKANHLTHEQEIVVASEDVHVETVELVLETDENEAIVKNVTIKHNCSFGNDFTLLYAIPKSELDGFENIRLSVEKDVYSGDTMTGTDTVILSWADYIIGSDEYYRFDYKNISATEVGDDLRATVIAEYDGEEYYGTVDIYNLKDYAYNRLTKSSDNTFKRMLVDMLDYCSAAQIFFDYRESERVNSELTSEQRALSTGIYATLQNNDATITERPDKSISTIRKNVRFGNRTELLFAMDLSEYPDRSRITMHVEYTDNYGQEQMLDIPGNKFEYNSSLGMYCGVVNTLSTAELRKVLQVTVLYDDEPISDTIAYSIETYICKKVVSSDDEVFKELLRELMVYGDSCEASFN